MSDSDSPLILTASSDRLQGEAPKSLLDGGVFGENQLLQIGLFVLGDFAGDFHELGLLDEDVFGSVDLRGILFPSLPLRPC